MRSKKHEHLNHLHVHPVKEKLLGWGKGFIWGLSLLPHKVESTKAFSWFRYSKFIQTWVWMGAGGFVAVLQGSAPSLNGRGDNLKYTTNKPPWQIWFVRKAGLDNLKLVKIRFWRRILIWVRGKVSRYSLCSFGVTFHHHRSTCRSIFWTGFLNNSFFSGFYCRPGPGVRMNLGLGKAFWAGLVLTIAVDPGRAVVSISSMVGPGVGMRPACSSNFFWMSSRHRWLNLRLTPRFLDPCQ